MVVSKPNKASNKKFLGQKKLRKLFTKSGIRQVRRLTRKCVDLLDPEGDAIGDKERLKYMQEYERWDEVKLLWKKCQHFRRKLLVEDESTNIINILTEWPCYKHPMGSTLIDLDFENIYPNATNIYEKLSLFFKIALEVFTTKIKDKHCKAVLGNYKMKRFPKSEELL